MSEENAEPKPKAEPSTFSAFFEKASAGLKETIEKLWEKQKPQTNLERLQELGDIAFRGQRVRAILESAAWKLDIEPFLRKESAGSQMPPWRPGSPTAVEELNAAYFFISGKAFAYTHPINQLAEWVREGAEAERTLAFEAKRRQQAAIDAGRNP